MEGAMELRHLRYFIAVAEEGSLTLAAEKRLHTAQPSLSRQIRDLEYEVGVELMSRSVHGIELTAAGKAFLDHARLALTQAEAAKEAARRAAQPAKPTFALGCLTGKEIDWLPEAMRILHDELSNIEVTVFSQNSPDLADALMRGRLDAAFMRPEERADDLIYRRVITEPFVVVFPSDHRLAGHDAIDLREIVGETFIIPSKTAPTLARCDRGLLEAVRTGYRSGSRSGQHYPCDIHDRVDRRRSASACLPKYSSSLVRNQPSDPRRCPNDRLGCRLQQGE